MPHANDVTRRTLLRCAALGTVALASGIENVFAQTVSRPPNIVFIMADDLGYADVSCYGRPDLSTPNIDRLAAKGVRFLQAYANSAVCSATRTALITGRYQYRLPLGLEEPLTGRDVGLPPEHPTLPSLLKKAGYGTTLVGKWHLGALPRFGPLQSGYDHFYGFRGGARGLLHARRRESEGRSLGRRRAGASDGLSDRPARQPRGGRHQRLREISPAIFSQPPLQCPPLAVGSAGRRGGVRAACAGKACLISTAARRKLISA